MTAPPIRLEGLTGDADLTVPPGRPWLIGRGAAADFILSDPSVSRHHAEMQAGPEGLRVRDLGSANGTLANGAPIGEAVLRHGDVLTLGRPAFRVVVSDARSLEDPPPGTESRAVGERPPIADPDTLRRLLALARTLSGRFERSALTAAVADLAFEVVAADRVALLLRDGPDGALVPSQSRSRVGEASALQVPRSIAGQAAREGRPVITRNALEDDALRSGSVVAARVRSAVAAPLLADEDRVIGVLYADRIASAVPFTDEEATTLLAFAGLAAVSLAKLDLTAAVQRQAETRQNLERFFAPDVAATIAAAGSPLGTGGERRTVTVLFSDIRGFTGLAEGLPPERVAGILNEYFTIMAEIIFGHGGTLDKFLGDGLLAVWGAPLDTPDDASRAVAAARAMREAVAGLNASWAQAGHPTLGVGLGLARGEVFAGRIGSDHRLDYTVIGDAVNLAARLCDLAPAGAILLTEEVRRELPAPAALEEEQGLEVRGRAGAVRVWRA